MNLLREAPLAALLLLPLSAAPAPSLHGVVSGCENRLAHEPILFYEVSGATLGGSVDRTFTVFADGSLRLTSSGWNQIDSSRTAQTSDTDVRQLQRLLLRAGAYTLCDDRREVMDVPMRTLTMLDGSPDGSAHTFSWWLPIDEFRDVEVLLDAAIAEHFPGV